MTPPQRWTPSTILFPSALRSFVNDKSLLTDSYSQYLRNKIREAYPAPGIPVIFSARSRVRND
ncbi:MAG: hypothetical protein ACLSUW_08660 [Akkermansia sp.]